MKEEFRLMKDKGTYPMDDGAEDEEQGSIFDQPEERETYAAEDLPPPREAAVPSQAPTPPPPPPPPLEPLPSPDDVKRWISQRETMIASLKVQHQNLLEQVKETETLLESLGASVQPVVIDETEDWRQLGVEVVEVEDVQGLPHEEAPAPKASKPARAKPPKPKPGEHELTQRYKNLLRDVPNKGATHPGIVLTENMKGVLKVMSKKPLKIAEIAARTEYSYQTVWATIKSLLKAGRVARSGESGSYAYAKA